MAFQALKNLQRRCIVRFTAVILASYMLASPASSAQPVRVLVLQEHSPGTAAQATPLLNSLLAVAAKLSGWSSAEGEFVKSRPAAAKYIEEKKPHFAILSLESFVAMRSSHSLKVIGQVSASTTGGQRYFLIGKSGTSAADCKGKTVASDHLDNERFIDRVVAKGAFKLADFKVEKTRRPVQTLKHVIRGKAECALIDDAQEKTLAHLEGGKQVKTLWKSAPMPAMPVVAFPTASPEQTAAFKKSLPKLCLGENAKACEKVGIQALKPAGEGEYQGVVSAYGP